MLRQPGKDARFYGGKSNPMEKRTRVRARMVSQAISELFKDADRVFVVGHQRPDMDSVGSGIGVLRKLWLKQPINQCWSWLTTLSIQLLILSPCMTA